MQTIIRIAKQLEARSKLDIVAHAATTLFLHDGDKCQSWFISGYRWSDNAVEIEIRTLVNCTLCKALKGNAAAIAVTNKGIIAAEFDGTTLTIYCPDNLVAPY
jgi:2',3'-cyclic-nucleotide 2'-phosphodiesterase (5'-nucleotidase family)